MLNYSTFSAIPSQNVVFVHISSPLCAHFMSLNDLGDAVMLNECLNAPHFLQPPTDKSSPLPLHQEPPPAKPV
jgi:hypothetical protein